MKVYVPIFAPYGIMGPNKQNQNIALDGVGKGRYEASFSASNSGVYQVRVKADGHSLRGKAFTREQIRSIAVWSGGNQPSPDGGTDGHDWMGAGSSFCEVIRCLLSEKVISREYRKRLQELGIDLDALVQCLHECCGEGHKAGKLRLGRLNEKALWDKLRDSMQSFN